MPAFAQSSGGLLTNAQIDVLVRGMREGWAKPGYFSAEKPPAYHPSRAGDAVRGRDVYATFCSSCHGQEGRGGRAGTIVDTSYLSLVSDQYLRTVTITGMPNLGAPDWRSTAPGKTMSDADVTDVVAWLASKREALSADNPGVSK
jgi:mono/diheme cytochrome c family protein